MQKLLLVYYYSENRATSRLWKVLPNMGFPPIWGGKNGDILSMRMQDILDSLFARPCSAPIGGGKKGEFRDWTRLPVTLSVLDMIIHCTLPANQKRDTEFIVN